MNGGGADPLSIDREDLGVEARVADADLQAAAAQPAQRRTRAVPASSSPRARAFEMLSVRYGSSR